MTCQNIKSTNVECFEHAFNCYIMTAFWVCQREMKYHQLPPQCKILNEMFLGNKMDSFACNHLASGFMKKLWLEIIFAKLCIHWFQKAPLSFQWSNLPPLLKYHHYSPNCMPSKTRSNQTAWRKAGQRWVYLIYI